MTVKFKINETNQENVTREEKPCKVLRMPLELVLFDEAVIYQDASEELLEAGYDYRVYKLCGKYRIYDAKKLGAKTYMEINANHRDEYDAQVDTPEAVDRYMRNLPR